MGEPARFNPACLKAIYWMGELAWFNPVCLKAIYIYWMGELYMLDLKWPFAISEKLKGCLDGH